uniref:Uncharacterized protein n=1 Tax=Picea glauca TaxID=3330 RepID=A0A101LTU9_PICGL|nr:hypothetical protein ABT39_MTgene3491 [Picea glauca]QHR89362.1 hypothetical protein Q903MT_gene3383 [Picea sitchensis]
MLTRMLLQLMMVPSYYGSGSLYRSLKPSFGSGSRYGPSVPIFPASYTRSLTIAFAFAA